MATPRPLTFWHVAGDIIWNGGARCIAIEAEQARALRDTYEDEASAAFLARDMAAARVAAGLWAQLGAALDALDTWRRVVGCGPVPVADFLTAGDAVAQVIERLSTGERS